MNFTDKYIQGLHAKEKPYRAREGGSDKGFGIQVTPNGTKTFFIAYESPETGTRRFQNLGRYIKKGKSLATARIRCRVARELLEQKIDPQTEEQRLERERREAAREDKLKGSLKQLFDTYIENLKAQGKSSYTEVQRAYDHDISTVLDETMKAKDVGPHHVKLVLAKVIKRKKLILANRLRAYMSAAFAYGIQHDHDPRHIEADVLFFIEANPVTSVPKAKKFETAGERDLSGKEILKLWTTLDESPMSATCKMALKLLLATGGQRVSELLGASRAEFDLDRKLWEIPGSRTKNGNSHVVPLGELAIELLESLRAEADSNALVLSYTEIGTPIPIWHLSNVVATFCDKSKFSKFTPRDLRRTAKTRMGELGLSKDIRDRLHNHSLSDVSSKHYDRYDYLKEKQQAMNKWDRYLRQMLSGKKAKIIPIKPDKSRRYVQ